MKRNICLIIFCLLPILIFAQMNEFQVKAALLEKFSRFVNWQNIPPARKHFVIGILGKDYYEDFIKDMYSNRSIKDRSVKITYPQKLADMENCDILFITSSYKEDISYLLDYLQNKTILTIADFEVTSSQNAVIRMMLINNKITYDINLKAAKKANLDISSLLLAVARKITT